MGRGLVEFEEMQQAYLAIKDIDKVIASESSTKLEDAWNVIAEVGKDKFDTENVDSMLTSMRDALVKIFREKEKMLNDSINLKSF